MSFLRRTAHRLDEDDAEFFDENVKRAKYDSGSGYQQHGTAPLVVAAPIAVPDIYLIDPTTYNRRNDEPDPVEDDVDPLDAFMNGIDAEAAAASVKPGKAKPKAERQDFDAEDAIDVYVQQQKKLRDELMKNPQLAAAYEQHFGSSVVRHADDDTAELSADDILSLLRDYDSDDDRRTASQNLAGAEADDDAADELGYDLADGGDMLDVDRLKQSRIVPPLAPLDHSKIAYAPFNKIFYEPHLDIVTMTAEKEKELRTSLDIRVSGSEIPRPCLSFGHFGFDDILLREIARQAYTQPTPIQCIAVPIALLGRDLIGIAKTGSGKTAAYLWPLLVHIMDQAELAKGDGPIGVIVSPTRELCDQIYQVAKQFSKGYGINVAPIYGGMKNKYDQFKLLRKGCEIVVATPGRLIDLLKMKATNMLRVTFLILDEADRMFDMGFGPQVQSIVGQIRPDRQTLLFSATMRKKVERLAREILENPIRITVGEVGAVNADVRQIIEVMANVAAKMHWLGLHLSSFLGQGPVLLFSSTKTQCEEVAVHLQRLGYAAGSLHGDKSQLERMELVKRFKKADLSVLCATDVAARGLDIKGLKTVINFDCARDIDSHTHRVGRTGRAGAQDGTAFTLLMPSESRFAGDLVAALEVAGQIVSPQLLEIAQMNPRFRKDQSRRGIGASRGVGGIGTRREVAGSLFSVGNSAVAVVGAPVGRRPSRFGPPPVTGIGFSDDAVYSNSRAAYSVTSMDVMPTVTPAAMAASLAAAVAASRHAVTVETSATNTASAATAPSRLAVSARDEVTHSYMNMVKKSFTGSFKKAVSAEDKSQSEYGIFFKGAPPPPPPPPPPMIAPPPPPGDDGPKRKSRWQ